ncbi:glycoside hydrolase family 16 [Fusarium beomiforme]|uniref:Glycoside hydrolase family 16 n=1 Tax=Fusarium beomiforme TaxID=44412 RepID=A0A9P5DQI0_9HYPO|nr:glycoside hydrolase family 16 [Fusarium beomiforme]
MFPAWLITLLSAARAAVPDHCTAFSINGPNTSIFDFYRFYDFRNVPTSADLPIGDPSSNNREPSSKLKTSRITNDSWSDDWRVSSVYQGQANNKVLARHYVADHVFLDQKDNSGRLVLYTNHLRNDTQQAGEIYFNEALVYSVSLRVYARITGAPGAVAGFFTYFNDTQESDIEVLTKDKDDRVQFSNQPTENTTTWKTIPGTTLNKTRSGSFRDWTVYRLDWLPDQDLTAWYINGQLMETSRINVPTTPSRVYINMWSNGGSFSGLMDYNKNATLEIQWIEMAFNASITDTEKMSGDRIVCSIEDGQVEPSSAGAKIAGIFGWWAIITSILFFTIEV